MSSFFNYLWPILLAIYIISPVDAHPLIIDDLIAAGVLFYYLYNNSRRKQQQQQYYNSNNRTRESTGSSSTGPLTLDGAYKLLGISPGSSFDDVSKAYKEKMTKSHPDKVSHLSEELQEKAKELTLRLNEAYDLIKKYRNK